MKTDWGPVSRRAFLGCLGVGLATVATGSYAPPSAHAATAAESFVSSIGKSVLAAARSGSGSQFRSLLRKSADIRTIALFSLGNYRSKLPANRQREYFSLFEAYIAKVFVSNASKLGGSTISVTGSQQRSDSVIVTSQIQFADGRQPMPVAWRLVRAGGGYKIFDVSIQGIWLAIQQRSNFVSLLNQNNGNMDALFNFLRK